VSESNYTITIPYKDYKELIAIREELQNLKTSICNCFEIQPKPMIVNAKMQTLKGLAKEILLKRNPNLIKYSYTEGNN